MIVTRKVVALLLYNKFALAKNMHIFSTRNKIVIRKVGRVVVKHALAKTKHIFLYKTRYNSIARFRVIKVVCQAVF